MSGRYAGELFVRVEGDRDAAPAYLPAARALMGEVLEQAAFNALGSHKLSHRMKDGAVLVESQDTREHRRQLVDLEKSKPFQVGQGEDGGQGIVRADGSFTPITDASGAPVKLAGQQQSLSPDALLKAYTDRANAIDSSTAPAEERMAARQALESDPMFAPLRAREVQHVTPSLEQFKASAKAAGSKLTDAQITQAFNERYGR